MFTEFNCGCIISARTGQVRICNSHPVKAGIKALVSVIKGKSDDFKITRRYPAYGRMVNNWSGK